MNKFIKITAITTLVSFVLTIFFIQRADFSQLKNFKLNFGQSDVLPEDLMDFDLDQQTHFAGADELEIKVISGDVKILNSPDENLHIKVKGKIEKKYASQEASRIVQHSGSRVTIDLGEIIQDTEKVGGSISLDEVKLNFVGGLEATIKVPVTYKKLKLGSVSGDTNIEKLKLMELNVQTISGDFKISDSSAEKLKIVGVSSDIELNHFSFSQARVETVSGDIELIPAAGFKFSAGLESISGEMKGQASESMSDNKISIKTVSGDVKIH